MQTKIFTSILIITLAISTLAGAQVPVLTIDSVGVNQGIVTVNYTVVASEGEFITTDWQFSSDDGETWLDINGSRIGNNDAKPAGSSFITWDIQINATDINVLFRMFVESYHGDIGDNPAATRGFPCHEMPLEEPCYAPVVLDGKIYFIGGFRWLQDVSVYNPSTDTCKRLADMPTSRVFYAAAAVAGKIYVIGGSEGNLVEEYDPSTDSWRTVADMPTSESWHAAVTVAGKIYVIGKGGQVLEYNPSTDTWRKMTGPPDRAVFPDVIICPRYCFNSVVALNGEIYVLSWGNPTKGFMVYAPSTDSWRMIDIHKPRWWYRATAVIDGKIYLASSNSAIDGYDPENNSLRTVFTGTGGTLSSAVHLIPMEDRKLYIHDKFNPGLVYTIPYLSEIATVDTSGSAYPRWDVNADGVVDISDLVLVGVHFGEDYRSLRAIAAMSEMGSFSGEQANVKMDVKNKFHIQGARLLQVDINIESVPNLYGCQFDLAFDANVLEVVGANAGGLLAHDGASTYWNVSQIDNQTGRVIGVTYVKKATPYGVNADGTLATIIFAVKNINLSDKTQLRLANVKLVDAKARFIKAVPEGIELNWEKLLLPETSLLLSNYPNPFNPETWIPYQLAHKASVAISIYNSKGQLIRTLCLGNQEAGIYVTKDRAAYWDGKDSLGEKVASSVYYYSLRAGEFAATRKMLILK